MLRLTAQVELAQNKPFAPVHFDTLEQHGTLSLM